MFFAGHGVISKGWVNAGEVALEEIEVYEQPHLRQGYRAHHDLSLAPVQQQFLHEIEQDVCNVEWIACPCTTFCDWGLRNGDTRTFDNPHGTPTSKEAVGNTLSEYGARLFEAALTRGHFPIAEGT